MADGDRVHPRLAMLYQKPYMQLCEGQFSGEWLADEVVYRVNFNLEKMGDSPPQLVEQVASYIDSLPKDPIQRSLINWSKVIRKIDALIAQAGVPKRIGEHIAEASRLLLIDIRRGLIVPQPNEQLMQRTFERFYQAEFEECIQLAAHYKNVSRKFVQERLDEMRPYVLEKLAYLAYQAAKRTTFQRLRRAPRVKPIIDLHNTDIEALS